MLPMLPAVTTFVKVLLFPVRISFTVSLLTPIFYLVSTILILFVADFYWSYSISRLSSLSRVLPPPISSTTSTASQRVLRTSGWTRWRWWWFCRRLIILIATTSMVVVWLLIRKRNAALIKPWICDCPSLFIMPSAIKATIAISWNHNLHHAMNDYQRTTMTITSSLK